MTGRTLGHYRVEGLIGQGGMGVVYRGLDTRLNRPVALKFLPREGLDPEVKARFVQEAETAAGLVHPNICPVHELVEEEGELFFAMALLRGRTLSETIGGNPLPPERVIEIGIQIAAGLEAAHRQNVVHRDIKSRNIVIDPEDGHVYILDFGLALLGGSTRLTLPGGVMGTPSYMAPEQATGEFVDHRTDIWSLGVVLFEMCMGRRPFDCDKDLGTVYTLINGPTPPLEGVPPGLAAVVQRALEKEPGRRWQTAGEIAGALRRLRGSQTETGETPTMSLPVQKAFPGAVKPKRRMTILAAAGIVALGLLGFWQKDFFFSRPRIGGRKAHCPFAVFGHWRG